MVDWKKLREIFASWGWALFAVAGVALAAIAVTIVIYAADGWSNPVAKLCFAFAQSILAAGMVAGVLRATQSIGFFKDELRAVIYADDLSGSLIDAKIAWRKLTRGLIRQRFKMLGEDALATLNIDGLLGSAEYMFEQLQREIILDWDDASRQCVRITEKFEATVLTADLGRSVAFVNGYWPESPKSGRKLISFRFSDGFDLDLMSLPSVKLEDGREEIRAVLPPSTRMRLVRHTVKTQDIDEDPFVNFRSNCLWNNPQVSVLSRVNDLRFYFRVMGVQNQFKALGGGDMDASLETLQARCSALCLPLEGYMVVLSRVQSSTRPTMSTEEN